MQETISKQCLVASTFATIELQSIIPAVTQIAVVLAGGLRAHYMNCGWKMSCDKTNEHNSQSVSLGDVLCSSEQKYMQEYTHCHLIYKQYTQSCSLENFLTSYLLSRMSYKRSGAPCKHSEEIIKWITTNIQYITNHRNRISGSTYTIIYQEGYCCFWIVCISQRINWVATDHKPR